MRAALASLVSARIGTQIAVLVVGALVLAHVAMAAAFLALHPVRPEQNSPFGAIERLALVVRMLDAEPDPGKRAVLLAQAQRADNGLSVLQTAPPQEPAGRDVHLLQDLQARLGPRTELFLARPDRSQSGAQSVVARLSDGTLLAVSLPLPAWEKVFLSPVTIGTLAFLASAVIILSWWAALQLTAPLANFADAAERFTADAASPPILEQGPIEVQSRGQSFERHAGALGKAHRRSHAYAGGGQSRLAYAHHAASIARGRYRGRATARAGLARSREHAKSGAIGIILPAWPT